MADQVGAGDFIPWEGGCLLIGRATSITPMHAHYAIQVAVGSESGIRFRTSAREEWMEYDAVIIPSRQPHTMDATHLTYDAVMFIEPETPAGRGLAERCGNEGILPLSDETFHAAAKALFATWQMHGNAEATAIAARAAIASVSRDTAAPVASDDRILKAVAFINAHLDADLTLENVAAEVCLSPSRFRHLFVEETGTALRPYILWRRFLKAWEIVIQGGSLSAAAHSAGFADAAHFSRTSNRMFGFPPSALQINARS